MFHSCTLHISSDVFKCVKPGQFGVKTIGMHVADLSSTELWTLQLQKNLQKSWSGAFLPVSWDGGTEHGGWSIGTPCFKESMSARQERTGVFRVFSRSGTMWFWGSSAAQWLVTTLLKCIMAQKDTEGLWMKSVSMSLCLHVHRVSGQSWIKVYNKQCALCRCCAFVRKIWRSHNY